MKGTRRACLALIAVLLPWPGGARAEAMLVFAAASLQEALDEAVAASGVEATVAYGASSTLARQIEQGAPAELFISASTAWMDYLDSRDLVEPQTRRDLVGNTLVLVAPATEPEPLSLAALPKALGDGRLAMGDPDHVPAGIYGKEALAALGLWEALAPRIARAESVRGALVLVESGEAPFGIVYGSDAMASDRVRVVASFPQTSHGRIVYPMALTPDAGPEATRLLDYLSSDEAKAIFEAHGFTAPGKG